tara:strand:+ start:502 stop:1440 length:939 start_codon:yes stop_codon:yes gene_type:complete
LKFSVFKNSEPYTPNNQPTSTQELPKKQNNMPYNTNGGSHRDGVSNEKKIVTHLNTSNGRSLNLHTLFGMEGLQFIQIGGTKSVSDMDILTAQGEKVSGVSIKNHKQGSYDYVNTSKLGQYLPGSVVESIKAGISAIKAEYAGDEARLPEARRAVESVLEAAFAQMSSEVIKSILQVINVRNPKLVMINDIKDKKLKCYHESSFTELSAEPYKASNTYALKSTRAKSSRQITRNGVVTNLRLRIVLNNGVKALLGLSKSNKYSIPVIKIQQDNVNAVLAETTMYSSCDFGVEPQEEQNNDDDLSAAMTGLTI